MKLITWNINGLRSGKKSITEILRGFDADIVCFQETKISRNLLPEDAAVIEGFNSYFSFPRKQSGYSGVATYCCNDCTPKKAEDGLAGIFMSQNDHDVKVGIDFQQYDLQSLDSEGRVMITYHDISYASSLKTLAIINVYCPRVDPEKLERHIFKMQFLELLRAKAYALIEEKCCVVIMGDLNISHRAIDHCDPGNEKEFDASESRQWLTSFLGLTDDSQKEKAFIDAFRYLHPQQREAYTCWNTLTGARQTNYGTRIDYFLISYSLAPILICCDILPDIHGSDHCPVSLNLECTAIKSSQLPSLCTSLWPEFSGKQQKLFAFIKKSDSISNSDSIHEPKRKSQIKNSAPKRSKLTCNSNNQKSIRNFFKTDKVEKQNEIKISEIVNSKSSYKENKELNDDQDTIVAMPPEESLCDSQPVASETEMTCPPQKKQCDLWKSVLSGPPKPPLCKGHNKPCLLRTVRKEGPNLGRQFFVCPQPNGLPSNPDARCDFFMWVTPAKKSNMKKS